jgi:multidrug efflux pump subunit AcrA (membrane-fusion protein)
MVAATLARDGLVAVELDLPAHRLPALDLGQTVALDLGQGQTLLADVTRLPFGTDGANPTAPVRFTLSGDHDLRPGMAVRASVTLSQRIAIRIPLGALTRHGDAHAVMRVIDGRAVATPVVLAATQPDSDTQTQIEITDGLRDGDLIVSLAATLLADGERVAVPGAPARRRLAGDLTGGTGP